MLKELSHQGASIFFFFNVPTCIEPQFHFASLTVPTRHFCLAGRYPSPIARPGEAPQRLSPGMGSVADGGVPAHWLHDAKPPSLRDSGQLLKMNQDP